MVDLSIFLTDLNGGGAEKVMLNLANGFAQQGQSVDLVLVRREGRYLTDIHPKVQLIDFGGVPLLKSLPLLINYLKCESPKTLLSALEDTNIIAICATKLSLAKTKVIVTVHNHLSSEMTHSTSWKRRVVPYFLRWFYPYSDAVVAVSHGVASDLSKWSGLSTNQIKVIYNPIVTPDLQKKYQKKSNHPWFTQNQIPVVLGIGRLHPQKDFSTLLYAFKEVHQKRPVRLLILGEGEQQTYLNTLVEELQIQDSVHLPGFVQNPYAYMAEASLCVLSSAWEGFGNVLVESMFTGTPVVSTDCDSGPAEILAHGKYGRLVPVGDVQGLAEAIIQTLDHPLDPIVLKQRAEEFSLDKALAQYEQLFSY